MSYTNRVLLRNHLIDSTITFIGVSSFFLLTEALAKWVDNDKPKGLLELGVFWIIIFLMFMAIRTFVLFMNIFKNFQYHRKIAISKIGSSYKRYINNPKEYQALDLLKDLLFALDWMSFSEVENYLLKTSLGHELLLRLDNPRRTVMGEVELPAPKLLLFRHAHGGYEKIAVLPLYK